MLIATSTGTNDLILVVVACFLRISLNRFLDDFFNHIGITEFQYPQKFNRITVIGLIDAENPVIDTFMQSHHV
ncbi:Uncharacterised protein [Vibrio cholerae]|uniref:Uncharacterized protein n=1 Tax=Vibrio cholerae TaxID=666 RepID=A0A655Z9V1_VIBCL|nr:Uncharacterised protein [Vibrio cholerae]CSA99801.1 Uncharacterised protein [Vibrio cholerae]CSB36704.1 Uncharacterised protein [Vibrio cholerae]CSB60030.1 Uncharacterised protein [Vibrio cholerae]CSB63420.1 Uncharacterised protein [Vibrio cholerae]